MERRDRVVGPLSTGWSRRGFVGIIMVFPGRGSKRLTPTGVGSWEESVFPDEIPG